MAENGALTNGNSKFGLIKFILLHPQMIPGVMLFVVVGMFTGYISSPITATEKAVLAHEVASATARDRLVVVQQTQETLLRQLIKAQQMTCVVLAKTENDRRSCLQ